MADNKYNIILNVKGDVARGMGKAARSVTSATKTMRSGIARVTKGIFSLKGAIVGLGAVAVVKNVIDAFAEQEAAVAQFNDALRRGGKFSAEYSKRMQDVASGLQAVGTQGDEAILASGKLLAMSEKIGKDALPRALQVSTDLAAALGIDLNAATKLVTNAAAGMTSTFTRYGIKIDEQLAKSGDFTAILAELERQVGGADAALRKTTAGSLKALGNTFGDLKESAGEFVAALLSSGFGEWLNRALKTAGEYLGDMAKKFKANEELSGAFFMVAKAGFKSVVFVATGAIDAIRAVGEMYSRAYLAALKFTKLTVDQAASAKVSMADMVTFIQPVVGGFAKMAAAAEHAGIGMGETLRQQIELQQGVVEEWTRTETVTQSAMRALNELDTVLASEEKARKQEEAAKKAAEAALNLAANFKMTTEAMEEQFPIGEKLAELWNKQALAEMEANKNRNESKKTWDKSADGVENLRRNMELLHPAMRQNVALAAQFQAAAEKAGEKGSFAMRALEGAIHDAAKAVEDGLVRALDQALDAAFEGQLRNAKDLGRIVQSMLKEIAKELIKIAIVKGVTAAVGAFAAEGAVFSGGLTPVAPKGGVTPFAKGGVVGNPTFAVIGEQPGVQEAVIPMPSGKVEAVVKGGGGGQNITINNHVQAIDAKGVAEFFASQEFRDSVQGAVLDGKNRDLDFRGGLGS